MHLLKRLSPLHWLLLALAAICDVALFNHGPIPLMEPRFAEAVREMFARGEWMMSLAHGN